VTAGAGGLGAGGAHGGAAGAEGGAASPADGAYFDGESRLDGLPETTCTVNVTSAELSPHIATVGIVTFTASLPGLTAAEIHFGPDLDHGLVAPVDLADPGHRTLLLGMDQDRTYHFRVAVSDGSSVCYGADATLETGSLHAEGLAEASGFGLREQPRGQQAGDPEAGEDDQRLADPVAYRVGARVDGR